MGLGHILYPMRGTPNRFEILLRMVCRLGWVMADRQGFGLTNGLLMVCCVIGSLVSFKSPFTMTILLSKWVSGGMVFGYGTCNGGDDYMTGKRKSLQVYTFSWNSIPQFNTNLTV